MRVEVTDIRAEVYAKNPNKDILYVKVTIPSLQMYINSCTVRPSPQYGGLWFQMPAFYIGRKWVKPIEFQNGSSFFDLIQDAAMREVAQYVEDKKLQAIFPGAVRTDQDEVHDVPF